MTEERGKLGDSLSRGITRLREQLGDPTAPITVVVTAGPNGVLARRALALRGPILRVWFETPHGLVRDQLPARFWRDDEGDRAPSLDPSPGGAAGWPRGPGLREAEAPGWLRVTLAAIVDHLAETGGLGRFGDQLRLPGWRAAVTSTVRRLAGDGITARDLRGLTAPPELAERAALLAALLEELDGARRRARLASPADIYAAASEAVGTPLGVGASRARGAIVLGDTELPGLLHAFMERWLGARPTLRLCPPPLGNLPLASQGLARSARGAALWPCDAEGVRPALRALQERLFRAAELPERSGGAPPGAVVGSWDPREGGPAVDLEDGSVVFARTPDDVREQAECVRVVQRAVLAGTPLDRIAIVVPDGAPHGALADALDRAELPCAWLVGVPAGQLPPAKLLRRMIDLALGEETALVAFELLTHPALDLRRTLGPAAIEGRGRWRRLLARTRSARGLDHLLTALERLPFDPARSEDRASEEHARASLTAGLRALGDAAAGLRGEASLGTHVGRWIELLERLGRRSEARAVLLSLLEPFARGGSGEVLSLARAREELDALLEEEAPRGTLNERSIRVLSPMHLLGAELDVVCLLGLTEGRFPIASREDALLPDALLLAISESTGRPLPLARAREELERRRFAASIGAARELLWLSSPALDFATERPTLPSSLSLAALSALLGSRAGHAELGRRQVRAGSRARAFPDDPANALGPAEHLLSRVATSAPATLPALVSHPSARGLLQLHRSMDRARRGGELDAWTGVVPPEVMSVPGLDGTPVPAEVLEALLAAPARLFFRAMLGAYPAPGLRPLSGPLEQPAVAELFARIAREETFTGGELALQLLTRAAEELEEACALGAFDRAELEEARPLLAGLAATLAAQGDAFCRAPAEAGDDLQVIDGLPWRLSALLGRVVEDGGREAAVLALVRGELGRKTKVAEDHRGLALSALALLTSGRSVDRIAVITPTGEVADAAPREFAEPLADALRAATERARRGEHRVAGDARFMLAGDARLEPPEEGALPEEESA